MENWYNHSESWSFIFRRFLPSLALYSLAWEIIQLPLYSIWEEAQFGLIAFDIAHCTTGDVLIGTTTLLLTLTLIRADKPGNWPMKRIGIILIVLTVLYTMMSERVNLAQGNWAYSSNMPILPWLDVGISPLLQWIFVPLATLLSATRSTKKISICQRG